MEKIEIGIIGKPSGLKGDVHLFLDLQLLRPIAKGEMIYLLQAGSEVPYLVERMEHINRNKWKLKLAGFDDVNAAETIKNLPVFAHEEQIKTQDGEEEGLEAVIGFHVEGPNGQLIGEVEDVIDNTQQAVLQIRHASGQEILIPAVEEFIVHIDFETQTLRIDPPEGLMELYM